MRINSRLFGPAAPRRATLLATLLIACLTLAAQACGGGEDGRDDGAGDTAPAVKTGVKPEPDSEVAVIDVVSAGGVNYGRLVIELYPNLAPKHVERFKTLVREGFYDGTAFHRVNPQAGVLQGGDPLSKDANPANDGTGGSDYPDLEAEFSDVPFDRGIVGAARSSDPNSANSQFYITLRRVPGWDRQYTVFGKVIQGMSDAQIMAGAPTRPGTENPAEPIRIQRAALRPRTEFQ
ncbi:MAG TPA: peptidylprolyl isomerase [Pyrinomonadaceae bacterium]|nr:peptidylprolyl isomerase [Pyrinomonadaceae bacterium]